MRDTPRMVGTVPERVRRIPDDPSTEIVVSVARFEIKDDDAYAAYSTAGHCGKPASGKCLYCTNHYAAHENDPTTRVVRQYVDNRGAQGNKGRENVLLCAHVTTPKTSNNAPPTPAITPTATTEKGQDSTMTATTANVTPNLLANVSPDLLNALLAALQAPATIAPTSQAPANGTASASTSQATNINGQTPAQILGLPQTATISFGDGLQGAGIAEFKMFKVDPDTGYSNHGYFASFKVVAPNGDRFQFTGNIAAIKPQEVRDAKKAAKEAKAK